VLGHRVPRQPQIPRNRPDALPSRLLPSHPGNRLHSQHPLNAPDLAIGGDVSLIRRWPTSARRSPPQVADFCTPLHSRAPCRLRAGVVTLPRRGREVSAPLELSGRRDCGPPRGHRHGAKRAVRVGRDEMALDVEGVVDGGVCGKKFLGSTRALEPLHFALPPTRRLTQILSSIVLPSPALMPAFHPKLSSRGAV